MRRIKAADHRLIQQQKADVVDHHHPRQVGQIAAHLSLRPKRRGGIGAPLHHVSHEDRADQQIERALHPHAPQRIIRRSQHQQRHHRHAQRQKHRAPGAVGRQHPPDHPLEPEGDPHRQRQQEGRGKGLSLRICTKRHRQRGVRHQQHRARQIDRLRQGRKVLKQAEEQADEVERVTVHAAEPLVDHLVVDQDQGSPWAGTGRQSGIPVPRRQGLSSGGCV